MFWLGEFCFGSSVVVLLGDVGSGEEVEWVCGVYGGDVRVVGEVRSGCYVDWLVCWVGCRGYG